MGTLVLRNAFFAVNGVDLSDHVTQLTLNYGAEMLDATVMSLDTRINKGGLKTWSLDMDVLQDYAAAKTDATLFPIVGTTSCVEVRPTNACSSASNPIYTGIAVLDGYPPITGSVGDLQAASFTFQAASALSRASSS